MRIGSSFTSASVHIGSPHQSTTRKGQGRCDILQHYDPTMTRGSWVDSTTRLQHYGPSTVSLQHYGPSTVSLQHYGPSIVSLQHYGPSIVSLQHYGPSHTVHPAPSAAYGARCSTIHAAPSSIKPNQTSFPPPAPCKQAFLHQTFFAIRAARRSAPRRGSAARTARGGPARAGMVASTGARMGRSRRDSPISCGDGGMIKS
jgi:hypothetical protein